MTSETEQYHVDALREDSAAKREDWLIDVNILSRQRQNRLNGTMSKLRVHYHEEQMKSRGVGGKWVSFEENDVKLHRLMRDVRELQDK
jgi:hypothetical protein